MRRSAHVHLIIASLLAFLMVGAAGMPASAGSVKRVAKAEQLAFKLVNCLRTGGYVTKKGGCIGYGSGKYSAYRPPFKRSQRISDAVSWPWAKRTLKATSNRRCYISHSLAGSTIDRRFRQAGLRHVANGENIGCGTFGPFRVTVFILRLWQKEKSYRGSHWRQIKAKHFKSVGVAVAKRRNTGKSQLVVNFYGRAVR